METRRTRATSQAVIVAVFVALRSYAHSRGVRFDASEWAQFWHTIEPELLRDRLGQSLYHLHAQPPLFNLWLGTYLKLFGSALPEAFALTFAICGLLRGLLTERLGRELGLPVWPRTIAALVVASCPAGVLYDNFLFYTSPVSVLVLACVTSFAAAARRRTRTAWLLFVSFATCLVLLRSLFHPLWLLACLGWMFWGARRQGQAWRPLVAPAALSLALVLAVMAKNQAVVGRFTLSSWSGMNLARVMVDRTPLAVRQQLVAAQVLSPYALVGGFKPLSDYPNLKLPPATGVPLLDRPHKQGGAPNFHHHAYVEISRQLGRDAAALILRAPARYAAAVLRDLRQSFAPAWTYRPLARNARHIQSFTRTHAALTGWVPGLGEKGVWLVIFPVLWVAAAVSAYRRLRDHTEQAAAFAYLLFVLSYVVGVGALFERSENQRFRFSVDPLLWLLIAQGGTKLVRALRTRTPAPRAQDQPR